MSTIPKLKVPIYEAVCPSGLKVSFRPFLVKEEKLLMMAMQAKDSETLMNAAKEILESCVGKTSNIIVDKLPLFDVEFLFLNLRARSIGEIVKKTYQCTRPDANNVSNICGAASEYDINLLDIHPTFAEGHNKYIQLTEDIGVTLRYPTFKTFKDINRNNLPIEDAFNFLVDCVESINDKDKVYLTNNIPKSEVEEFVNSFNHTQIAQVDLFFDTIPKIQHTIKFKCPKCHHEEDIIISGLENFFE